MSRWRIYIVLGLVLLPLLFLMAAGSYHLWESGFGFYLWWPMASSLMLGYLLGWYWQRKNKLLRPMDNVPPIHWTDRDRRAWGLVEARAKVAAELDADRMSDPDLYVQTAKDMALELARFYHPNTPDPVSNLTIPEMLAVMELASHDLAEMVDQYLPGGHLLTIRDWKRAKQAADWYQTASNIYWVVSAVFSPLNTGIRFAASQLGLSRPWQMLQQNLLVWFVTAYIHRLGNYLIDLNSGRLRVGARRYRELLAEAGGDRRTVSSAGPSATRTAQGADSMPQDEVDAVNSIRRVTVTLFGQVKAGKSSLVNGLLGEQLAKTDVLPATSEVTRYELQPEGIPTRLVLLDTVGYGHTGPKADQLRVTEDSARQSDLLLLVLHSRNPARQADLAMLQGLRAWFAGHPDVRMPPILAVVTHIDLLTPSLEWSPPYNWQRPKRTKEEHIGQAIAAVREQLGDSLAGVIPVCVAPNKVYGIDDWLLPAVAELLDEVHAVAFLRCLRAEIDTVKMRKFFHQLLAAGKELVRAVWAQRPGGEGPTALSHGPREGADRE